MSDTPIRRSNWPAQEGENDDPLAELERIVGRKPASAAPATPPAFSSPASSAPTTPSDQFLGISEGDFEAAFRSLNAQAQAQPAPAQPDQTQQSSPPLTAPARQPFTSRIEPAFKSEPSFEADEKTYAASSPSFEDSFASSLAHSKNEEFETRADIFDFDTRASGDSTENEEAVDEESYSAEPAYYLENRQRSGLVTVIAVTGLVFVAVIGALVYSWVGSDSAGEPVVIKADTSPVKTMAKASDNQPSSSKLIYDRLGNANDDQASTEKLVSREEQPMDTLNPQEADSQNPRAVLPDPDPAQETGGLNAPRQVTTTTIRVRPDGTLENVPNPVESTASTTESATAKTNPPVVAVETTPRTTPAPVEADEPAPPAANLPAAAQEENTAASENAIMSPAPQPSRPQRPAQQPLRIASAPATQTAPRTSTASTAANATSPGGGFVVQISSQKSDTAARASFSSMQQRYPQVLSGYQASIKPVTLGERGTYYRVRVGPLPSRDEAAALCTRLKSAGGDCVVTAN